MESTPETTIDLPTTTEESAEGVRHTGLLWMGAGAFAGGVLISLWLGLAVLAAKFQLPAPPPGLLALGLLVGGGLFQEGLRIARGEPDVSLLGAEAWALRRTLIFLLILVGCGAIAEALAPGLPLLILPFHIGVAALGPLWWFNLLRWRLHAPWTRREGWWGLGLGSLLVPALALFLEGIAIALLAFGFLIIRMIVEGPGFLEQWLSWAFPPEKLPELPERLTADPWVWIGVLIGAALLVPLIEEILKPLPAVLRIRDPQAPRTQAILYGALGGAGFALAENLLSWQLGTPWALMATGRLGATALHVFNGGLMGWAWSGLRQGRFLESTGAYLFAWLLHGLWNAGAIALSGALLAPLSEEARALVLPPALISMGIAMLMVLGGLWQAWSMLGDER
ncbi:MAG: PrsW family glutamic-type intramembrane protease [Thermoflexus sp.]